MSSDLIEDVFLPRLKSSQLLELDDAALLKVGGQCLAMTTDSYVVSPIFFPGGDIGSLAVHGTVNDLSMRGARPLFISAAFILEEGFPIEELTRIVDSLASACAKANITLVAADTKVVGKGAVDKIFITTTGIGIVEQIPAPAANRAEPGDIVIVSGDIGRHGMAIMTAREELEIETDLVSDSAPLHDLVENMLGAGSNIHCMRDITRGGLASVLNELAHSSNVGIDIQEDLIPVNPQVKAICELLGLDPLYVACEGRLVAIAAEQDVESILKIMNKHELGKDALAIGKITVEHPQRVVLRSTVGGNRILDKLSGEQLPRIC